MKTSLLLGCGNSRQRKLSLPEDPKNWYENLITLDIDTNSSPDIFHDLSSEEPIPLDNDSVDEIHAYEVLEHIGQQGDYRTFFRQFEDYWRILKPNGRLYATVPRWDNMWAWGDPGHTRIVNEGTLIFLDQDQYNEQVGKTAMTDYRWCYEGNFKVVTSGKTDSNFYFILSAVKEPSASITS